MTKCPHMFHGITRQENGDGTVTLTLSGWSYTTGAERRAGAGPVRHAGDPCETRTVPVRTVEWVTGQRRQVIESADAAEMVTGHCGAPYTVMWQGKGWTVELRTGYPLWRVTC